MSSRPLVSIISPTCNHERFISAAMASVLAQDFTGWEMTVIDDASRDGTAGIVAGYSRRDARIRLVRHATNWGMDQLAATYNEGLSTSSGEWVAILEGDDAWPPGKLSWQLEELAHDQGIVLGFGRSVLLSASGERLREVQAGLPAYFRRYFENFRGPVVEPLLLRPCFIHPVTVMIRRDALEKIGGFRQPRGLGLVDHPTFLELAQQGPFFGSARVLGNYRRHRDSQSLNRIVELTAAERSLAFEFLPRADVPNAGELRRRMDRSWALEGAKALLTEGRLRLLRGQRRAARRSFWRSLLAEKPARWLHLPLLATKAAALAAMAASFLPFRLERIAGRLKGRSASLLELSDR